MYVASNSILKCSTADTSQDITESIDISFISITFYSYYHCYILVVVHLACSQY